MRFEDTEIWQNSVKLSKDIYRLSAEFPPSEQFGLTSQIRRASNSVSANFAEGYGRFSKKDKHHFYTIAYGSLLETKSFLLLAAELGFIDNPDVLVESIESLQKQLNALMKTIRS